jgi:geranyl-CoA carboxylase alpha subunit
MVAKVIAHGRDRDDAIRRLRAALANTPLLGLKNNGRFLSDLVDHPAFRQAQMTTTLIDQWQESGEPLLQAPVPEDAVWCMAAVAFAVREGSSWRSNSVAAFDLVLEHSDRVRTLRVRPDAQGGVDVVLEGAHSQHRVLEFSDGIIRYEKDSCIRSAFGAFDRYSLHLAIDGHSFQFNEVSAFPSADTLKDASRARSPVAGRVTQVLATPGMPVTEGQQLVCVEAMKMEMWLCAEGSGTVKSVHVNAGDQVESGALLVEIEALAGQTFSSVPN